MTNAALAWGSALIAFCPILSLLFFLSYPKAQLVIVVTTAAFFFLCSSLAAGLVWYVLDEVIGLPGGSTLWVLLPGVVSQFLFRCAFVRMYHVVEQVIQNSLERYELQHPPVNTTANTGGVNDNQTAIGSDDTIVPPRSEEDDIAVARTTTAPNASSSSSLPPQQQQLQLHQWARLQLELNDFACAIAAATGFGGMHAILFYGTLLASETSLNRHATGGTLYQPSCLNMPSLVVSAIMTMFFSILDVYWMLLTFFGMRRRMLFQRSSSSSDGTMNLFADHETDIANSSTHHQRLNNNSRGSGNVCLLFCLVSHLAASLATTANIFTNGCVASLPLLGVVTVLTAIMYTTRIHRIYLPPTAAAVRNVTTTTTTTSVPPPALAVGVANRLGLVVNTAPDPYHRD
jgi:hypothetical protein